MAQQQQNVAAQRGVMCGLKIKMSYLWILYQHIKLIKSKEMPSDVSSPQCSGKVDVDVSEHIEVLLEKFKLALLSL